MTQQNFILEKGKVYAYDGKVYGGPGEITRSYEKIGNYVYAPLSEACALILSYDLGIPGSDKKPIELPEYNGLGMKELVLYLVKRAETVNEKTLYSNPEPISTPKKPIGEEIVKGVTFKTTSQKINFFAGKDGKMVVSYEKEHTHKGMWKHCKKEK